MDWKGYRFDGIVSIMTRFGGVKRFPSGWRVEAWNNGSKGPGFEDKIGFEGKLRSWDGTGTVPYGVDVLAVRHSERGLTHPVKAIGSLQLIGLKKRALPKYYCATNVSEP